MIVLIVRTGQALVATVVSGVDGKAVWMCPLAAARSPATTDESSLRYSTQMGRFPLILVSFFEIFGGCGLT